MCDLSLFYYVFCFYVWHLRHFPLYLLCYLLLCLTCATFPSLFTMLFVFMFDMCDISLSIYYVICLYVWHVRHFPLYLLCYLSLWLTCATFSSLFTMYIADMCDVSLSIYYVICPYVWHVRHFPLYLLCYLSLWLTCATFSSLFTMYIAFICEMFDVNVSGNYEVCLSFWHVRRSLFVCIVL